MLGFPSVLFVLFWSLKSLSQWIQCQNIPFTFPFCQTCLPIEVVVPSSLPCINNVVLMLCPLFPECSSSQFKSSFVSLVVIDVVPYCGLDDSVEESIHRDVVFCRRWSAPEEKMSIISIMSSLVCLCPILFFVSCLSTVGPCHICVVFSLFRVCILIGFLCSWYWFVVSV